MVEISNSIISGIVGSGIITAIILLFFRSSLNFSLLKFGKKIDKEIEQLKGEMKQRDTILNNSIASLISVNKLAQEKKVSAIEELWGTILDFRNFFGPCVLFYDILTPKEYLSASQKGNFSFLFRKEFHTMLNQKLVTSKIEEHRPFLGEKIWNLFTALRTFEGRISLSLILNHNKGELNESADWRKDRYTMTLLENTLSDSEIKRVKSMSDSATSTVINLIELKILNEVSQILSGKEIMYMTFDYAQELASKEKALRE